MKPAASCTTGSINKAGMIGEGAKMPSAARAWRFPQAGHQLHTCSAFTPFWLYGGTRGPSKGMQEKHAGDVGEFKL